MFIYKIQKKLILLSYYAGCLCMLYLMVFISLDVILRSFGISYFVGTVQLSEYSLLAIALLCAPWVYRINANLKVDIFLMNKSDHFKRMHAYGVNWIILISSLIVCYYASLAFIDSIERNRFIYKILVIPEWYINWIIPFSMFMISTVAIEKLFFHHKGENS